MSDSKRSWRAIFLWALVILSALYVVPTFTGKDKLPDWYPFSKQLNFGLDLQGGLELRYTVDWKKAIEQNGRKLADAIKARVVDELAKKDNKNAADLPREEWDKYASTVTIEIPDYSTIRIAFADAESAKLLEDADLRQQLDERYEYLEAGDNSWDLIMRDDQIALIRGEVVKQTRSTIQKRVESFGLVDPDVRVAGDSDIVVQIPGVGAKQMRMVRERVGQTALLTLRMVDRTNTWLATQKAAFEAYQSDPRNKEWTVDLDLVPSEAEQAQRYPELRGRTWYGPYVRSSRKSELVRFVRQLELPSGNVLGFELDTVREGNIVQEKFWRTHLLTADARITGDHLARAQVLYDEQGPYVSLDFNSEGGREFADLTEANVGEYMAVMLDEDINSAPQIKEKIGGGRARITMGGSTPQAKLEDSRSLTNVLNNGAYKAPVFEVHHHEVGPSLGSDSVDAGTTAMALGLALVVAFMLLYYKTSGVIAVAVLLLNMVFILALLISMNSALTLPGMAGIILTIGMAVDANIIIYERIREEAASGRSPRAAVDAGYEKAFSTILDANVTTALAGVILLNYTSGPIRGFAVTLLIGIVCSVFTAVYVSRRIFNWYLTSRNPSELSI
jgi:preprotein translocase subunit SecD